VSSGSRQRTASRFSTSRGSPELDGSEAQLARVVVLLERVLGDDLLGLYLHGSAVAGGLRPGSDLDLLAVVAGPLSSEQRSDLVRGLLGLSGRGDPSGRSRPLEVSVVRADQLRPWRYPPEQELQYGDWWRGELAAGLEPWRSPNADLAILVAATRAAGRPLAGPPPTALLDEVPLEHLVASSVAGIDGLLADLASDTRNVLLTLARIWVTVVEGRIARKDEAARWAAMRLSAADATVILDAGEAYAAGAAECWDDRPTEAQRCADALVAAIHAAFP
jgi:predicted nucleotidyltransferase